MDCVFCKIINGELPAQKVYESAHFIAIEDINKVAPVHVLIIPKTHFESIMELPETEPEIILDLHKAIQSIAKTTGIAESGFRLISNKGRSAGQSVFHLHFHLIGGRELDVKLG